jgi:hypothetical protein
MCRNKMKRNHVYDFLHLCENVRTCRNKMKRNHVYDFSSFYLDTFPLILVFSAAFIEEYTSVFLILTVLQQQIF